MATPRWDLFVGVAVLLAVVMLGLARATQRALSDAPEASAPGTPLDSDGRAGVPVAVPSDGEPDEGPGHDTHRDHATEGDRPAERQSAEPVFGTRLLLANVIVSHGLLGTFLLATAWYAELPLRALGLDGGLSSALLPGVALGLALSAGNEAAARLADRSGIEYDERLRELLAPETRGGWAVLLLAVLPIIAGVEELLFRGALVGAAAAGYGLPVWPLVVLSSVLFGLGHGLQGRIGIVVTASLGFVLAAAFVVTDSLWVVIVAHYLVNALEFVVHEGPS